MARTISDAATEICSLRHGIENAAWEEARGKLMAYLRLRGSRVGGDQEEYGALKNEIEKFIERIDEDDIYSPSHDEITRLREENARLREALKGAEKGQTATGKNSHGCRVCGLQLVDDLGRLMAMGYSCRRDDCPSRVIC